MSSQRACVRNTMYVAFIFSDDFKNGFLPNCTLSSNTQHTSIAAKHNCTGRWCVSCVVVNRYHPCPAALINLAFHFHLIILERCFQPRISQTALSTTRPSFYLLQNCALTILLACGSDECKGDAYSNSLNIHSARPLLSIFFLYSLTSPTSWCIAHLSSGRSIFKRRLSKLAGGSNNFH